MYSSKFRTISGTCNRNITRTVAVGSTFVKANEKAIEVKSWKDIPGPSSLPFIGQLHHFLPGGSLYKQTGKQMFEMLYKTYGPIVKLDTIFKPPAIVLTDAESIAQVYHSENWTPNRPILGSLDYYRRYYKKPKKMALQSIGLATDQGETWKELRSKVNPAVLNKNIVNLYTDGIEIIAQDMIDRLRYLRDENNVIRAKLGDEMKLWALESIGLIALGCRLNALDIDSKDPKVLTLIQCSNDIIEIADKLDFKPSFWKYYPTKTFKRAMKVYEDMDKTTKIYLDKALEASKVKKEDSDKSVLERLLEVNEDVAHLMACDLLMGGIDTTSNTMLITLHLLATNPDKQTKLREEILSKEEKRPYLKACLKESLRVMPIAEVNIRKTTKRYNLMGYEIPKDTIIMFSHHILSTMDSHFPKPHEFIPERWIVDQNDPLYYGNAHPFANMPFGFGVRSCIGRRIAELELEIFLAKLIENFHVEWFGPPAIIKSTYMNYLEEPINLKFIDV